MKASILRRLRRGKRRIIKRLAKANRDKYRRCADGAGPVIDPPGVKYELADEVRGINYGGVGLMWKLAKDVGLVEAIDRRLHLLGFHWNGPFTPRGSTSGGDSRPSSSPRR